ncbi:hypothetical protein EZV62_020200 [Acer yangbiense]|uniref:Uncharacterized protein n=1 Tax=Acer yangbiense TaxID=1000413 RepID=A0A5C7HD78_9ROSI|nr:hypothetical protein EZV62_020200 [Acer yangbiense]
MSSTCRLLVPNQPPRSKAAIFLPFGYLEFGTLTFSVVRFPLLVNMGKGLLFVIKSIHREILILEFDPSADVVFSVLPSRYVKSGNLSTARELFNSMTDRTAVSWTILIGGYSHNNQFKEAFKLFVEMRRVGSDPDSVTYATLLSGCNDPDMSNEVIQIHADVVKFGCNSDIIVCNSLVDSYCKISQIDLACQLFGEMPERDSVTFNALITGYAKEGLNEEAIKLFMEMQHLGFKPSDFTFAAALCAGIRLDDIALGQLIHSFVVKCNFVGNVFVGNSLVDMYAKCGRFKEARKIFANLRCRSTVPWTAMISGYVQTGQFEEGLKLFNEMHRADVSADQSTFASILKASANLASLSLGKQLHSFVIRSGFMTNVFSGSALLDMYAKCGSVKEAIQIFQEMPERNIVSWNALISAYAQNGDGEATLRSFEEMIRSGFQPNSVSFLSVVSACSHSGLVEEGLRYFNSMTQKYKLTPKKEHYASMIDMFCRKGHFDDAEKLIAEMPFEPEEIIWSSVLNSCRIHKNQELAKKAADHLFKMEMLRDAAPYVGMSNIYAVAGQWDSVSKVKKAMRDRGVKKVPGCSWVEVKNSVYIFNANDKLHPQMEQIGRIIETLMIQMEKEEGYKPDTSCALHDEGEEIKIESLQYHNSTISKMGSALEEAEIAETRAMGSALVGITDYWWQCV